MNNEFEIGQTVNKANYTAAAIWCNKNGAHIEEQGGKYVIEQNAAPTGEEVCFLRIKELKALLAQTDYKAIKYAEGLLSGTMGLSSGKQKASLHRSLQ